jgi:hypothetical protein
MTHPGTPPRRGIGGRLAGACAALALTAVSANVASVAAQIPARPIAARAARTVSVNDTGHLKRLHASGEIFIEEGTISGTLPGTAQVRLDVGEQITATFTIRVDRRDSITGTGRATPTSSARYTSFAGTLTVTGGTGRYAHAHGTGKLYGALERKSDNLSVQTREGTLDY